MSSSSSSSFDTLLPYEERVCKGKMWLKCWRYPVHTQLLCHIMCPSTCSLSFFIHLFTSPTNTLHHLWIYPHIYTNSNYFFLSIPQPYNSLKLCSHIPIISYTYIQHPTIVRLSFFLHLQPWHTSLVMSLFGGTFFQLVLLTIHKIPTASCFYQDTW